VPPQPTEYVDLVPVAPDSSSTTRSRPDEAILVDADILQDWQNDADSMPLNLLADRVSVRDEIVTIDDDELEELLLRSPQVAAADLLENNNDNNNDNDHQWVRPDGSTECGICLLTPRHNSWVLRSACCMLVNDNPCCMQCARKIEESKDGYECPVCRDERPIPAYPRGQ